MKTLIMMAAMAAGALAVGAAQAAQPACFDIEAEQVGARVLPDGDREYQFSFSLLNHCPQLVGGQIKIQCGRYMRNPTIFVDPGQQVQHSVKLVGESGKECRYTPAFFLGSQ